MHNFLAVVHIIVYAGAIMVLFLYVIMMLNLNKDIEPHKKNIPKIAAVISAGVLMMAFVALLKDAEVSMLPAARNSNIGLIDSLGKTFFDSENICCRLRFHLSCFYQQWSAQYF
jgi:NADH-quinone oxidoreductase subunit J